MSAHESLVGLIYRTHVCKPAGDLRISGARRWHGGTLVFTSAGTAVFLRDEGSQRGTRRAHFKVFTHHVRAFARVWSLRRHNRSEGALEGLGNVPDRVWQGCGDAHEDIAR